VDSAAAAKIQSFLKSSRNLNKLILPTFKDFRQYGKEGFDMLLDGVHRNTSLHELSIVTVLPQTVMSALKGKTILWSLTLDRTKGETDEDYDFEGVKYLHGLRFLGIGGFRVCDSGVARRSLIMGLKESTSLEEIASQGRVSADVEIRKYLSLNRWFNLYSQELVQAAESCPQELWPHILGRVSFNVNILHSLVRVYLGTVGNGSSFQERRSSETSFSLKDCAMCLDAFC